MTETNLERSLGYKERLISVTDYEPEVHVAQITRKDDNGIERHRNIPELHLVGDIETIKLRGRPMRKLVSNYMGFGYRNLTSMVHDYDRTILNDMLAESYQLMTAEKLRLQERGGVVTRLTTDAFEGIDTEQVAEVITNRLRNEGVEFTARQRFEGVNTQYLLKNHVFGELGGEVTASVGFTNENSGESSFSLFGGGNVQVCSNGMIFGDLTERIRVIHKVDFSTVAKQLEHGLGQILSGLELVPKQLLALKEIPITRADAEDVMSMMKIPEYLQRSVGQRLWAESHETENGTMDWDKTLYGVYMAMTYVGSHAKSVQKSKNVSIDITNSHVTKLQDINTLRDAWDLREKELENTDAIKVEQ